MDSVGERHGWLAALTVVLQVFAALPFFLSGLIAPPRGVLAMKAVWVGFIVLAVVVFRRNPPLAPAVPGIAVVTAVLLIFLGGTFLWAGRARFGQG